MMIKFNFTCLADELKKPVEFLCDDYGFSLGEGGIEVQTENKAGSDVIVSLKDKKAQITYDRRCHFFRALGLLIEAVKDGKNEFEISEKPQFTSNGPMFDVSQGNAAIRVDVLKKMIRQMAIMGLDTLMLYCEDTFDVKQYPFFGYMRARYSKEDIRECDAYADMFGIEMIPCIQTLAHLADALRWAPFKSIAEDHECLLVGEEKTYEFIECVLREATEPFKTKKVHIGMDEAWKLGRGQYMNLHGYVDPLKIMKEHLTRVIEITNKLGLEPMMWSDMFFRSISGGSYYTEKPLPDDVFEGVPDNVRLIYWDYYNHGQSVYDNMAEQHTRFKSKPIFAGGIWTWIGYGPHFETTFHTTEMAMKACKKYGITDILATIWGDCGTECLVTTTMLGLSLFAEYGYAEELDFERFKKRFEFCTGARYDDFYELEKVDGVPSMLEYSGANPSKCIMWQDILTGLYDKNIEGLGIAEHYAKLAKSLEAACERNGWYNSLFKFNRQLAETLSVKSKVGIELTRAYRENDRKALEDIRDRVLPLVIEKEKALRDVHFDCWFELYNPLGWDIIDMRYASAIGRAETALKELTLYLDGKLEKLIELEQERLHYNGQSSSLPHQNYYPKIASPSRILTVI